MKRLWRHWVDDSRSRYVDPNDGELKADRRRPWQIVGPGQIVLYFIVFGALIAGSLYVHTVSTRFDQQHRQSQCIRAALRPIVEAAAEIRASPKLLKAEHQFLRATEGVDPKGC